MTSAIRASTVITAVFSHTAACAADTAGGAAAADTADTGERLRAVADHIGLTGAEAFDNNTVTACNNRRQPAVCVAIDQRRCDVDRVFCARAGDPADRLIVRELASPDTMQSVMQGHSATLLSLKANSHHVDNGDHFDRWGWPVMKSLEQMVHLARCPSQQIHCSFACVGFSDYRQVDLLHDKTVAADVCWSNGLCESFFEPLHEDDWTTQITPALKSTLPGCLLALRVETVPSRVLTHLDADIEKCRNVYSTLAAAGSDGVTPTVGYVYVWNFGSVRFHQPHPSLLHHTVNQWLAGMSSGENVVSDSCSNSHWMRLMMDTTLALATGPCHVVLDVNVDSAGVPEIESCIDLIAAIRSSSPSDDASRAVSAQRNKYDQRAILLLAMERRYKALSKQLLHANDTITELEATVAARNDEIQQASECARLNAETFASVEESLMAVQAKLSAETERSAAAEKNVEAKLKKLQSTNADLRQKLAESEARLNHLIGDVESKDVDCSKLSKANSQLTKQLEQLTRQLEEQSASAAEREQATLAHLAETEGKQGDMKLQLTMLEKKRKSELKALEAEKRDLASSVTALQTRLDKSAAIQAEWETERIELLKHIAALEKDNQKLTAAEQNMRRQRAENVLNNDEETAMNSEAEMDSGRVSPACDQLNDNSRDDAQLLQRAESTSKSTKSPAKRKRTTKKHSSKRRDDDEDSEIPAVSTKKTVATKRRPAKSKPVQQERNDTDEDKDSVENVDDRPPASTELSPAKPETPPYRDSKPAVVKRKLAGGGERSLRELPAAAKKNAAPGTSLINAQALQMIKANFVMPKLLRKQ